MRIKTISKILLIAVLAIGISMVASPSVFAGDYVKTAKVTLRGQYVEKLKPVYAAWDKHSKDAMGMYPDQIAIMQAQIAIAESAAAENDMAAFKAAMKKLKKAPKTLKKLAGKAKLYFQPYGIEMK
jgi:hypothetical protein